MFSTFNEPQPSDERLLYLPIVLGLLGFNLFHQGDWERSRLMTQRAAALCHRLGDVTGCRIYEFNLTWIDAQSQPRSTGGSP